MENWKDIWIKLCDRKTTRSFLSYLQKKTFFPFCLHKMQIFFSSISANCLEKRPSKQNTKISPKILQFFCKSANKTVKNAHHYFCLRKAIGFEIVAPNCFHLALLKKISVLTLKNNWHGS